MQGRNVMNRCALLSLSIALLVVGCSLTAVTPPPGIPMTESTLPPTPSTLTPLSGSALSFDGQDDYVLVPHDPSLDLQNSFTIAAWIYLEGYTEWASIVTKGNKPNVNNYAVQQSGTLDPIYRTESGKLRFSGCTALSAPLPESGTTIPLQQWNFVAVTFDGLQINFYWNGRLDGSHAVQGPLCTNDQPLYIGVDLPLTTEYWHGAIDELRIWNAPLSESEINAVMSGGQTPLETALVGYWSFDEGGGLVAHDQSIYTNGGLLVGDPLWIRPGAPIR